ncbi:hypothetical protein D3C86_1005320 [compost metagenome]
MVLLQDLAIYKSLETAIILLGVINMTEQALYLSMDKIDHTLRMARTMLIIFIEQVILLLTL